MEKRLIDMRNLLRHGDVMGLYIEDEELGFVGVHGSGIMKLRGVHSETFSIDGVHGCERQGHGASRAQELAAVHARTERLSADSALDLVLEAALLRRLRHRMKLFVGDDLRRNGEITG